MRARSRLGRSGSARAAPTKRRRRRDCSRPAGRQFEQIHTLCGMASSAWRKRSSFSVIALCGTGYSFVWKGIILEKFSAPNRVDWPRSSLVSPCQNVRQLPVPRLIRFLPAHDPFYRVAIVVQADGASAAFGKNRLHLNVATSRNDVETLAASVAIAAAFASLLLPPYFASEGEIVEVVRIPIRCDVQDLRATPGAVVICLPC